MGKQTLGVFVMVSALFDGVPKGPMARHLMVMSKSCMQGCPYKSVSLIIGQFLGNQLILGQFKVLLKEPQAGTDRVTN